MSKNLKQLIEDTEADLEMAIHVVKVRSEELEKAREKLTQAQETRERLQKQHIRLMQAAVEEQSI